MILLSTNKRVHIYSINTATYGRIFRCDLISDPGEPRLETLKILKHISQTRRQMAASVNGNRIS